MIVGLDEGCEMSPELIMAVVVVAPDRCFLEGAVHALDLAVRPGMVRLGEAMIDIVLRTSQLKSMRPDRLALVERLFDQRCRRRLVAWRGELSAVIGENGMDFVGNSVDQMAQEVTGNPPGGPFMQFDKGKF